ncbi:unnamed protein product [Thlaspi arvense]|uniref:FCP1 homology domain-containing protein n=1 Tax=Thlaspi arvense TaxID=13288 RepID=A0AAU9RBU4_THLAR|nr:unnamed protein product [Thlaspi arvense]
METVSLETTTEATVSNSNECQPNLELSDKQKNRSGKKKKKSRKKKNKPKSNDSHINNQTGKADEAASFEERKEGETEKTTSEVQVQFSGNCLSTLPIASCQRASVSREESGVTLVTIDPILSTKEDSVPVANRNGSNRKKPRRRKKKKEDALCGEKMLGEDLCQQAQDSCEKPEAAQLLSDPALSTREDSQPDAINMTCCGRKRQRRKRKRDKEERESGVETNSEVATICDARHDSEAEGSKLMSIEDKSAADVVIIGRLKSKDVTVEQQMGADVKANDTVSQIQNPKRKKKKRRTNKTMAVCDTLVNAVATSMKSGSVECMETAGVCDVRSKKRKSKKKKRSSTDRSTADMEVCDPSGNALLATVESGSVDCLLDHSNKEVLENCDRNAAQEFLGEDGTSRTGKSATEEIRELQYRGTCKEQRKDEIGDSKQKRKRKKSDKKKKSCEDYETDNMDEKKDDVSEPRNEEELESAEEKLETSLSTSVLILNNVAQGVASPETGDIPRCSCEGKSTRKLVVFDLNGILVDIARGHTGQFVPDGKISARSVFRRPFVTSFIDFCFERFNVGIWSSRLIGLDYMTNVVMGNYGKNLLFCFDQSICITTGFKTLENSSKPLFLKDLRRVWDRFGACLNCGKRKYDETNTLLVDDSPDKALCNPPHTGIFPFPYQYTDLKDCALGPDGELRKYLERLVDAENVQKFVEENPIGQTAITETHQSWDFYSKVVKAHKSIQGNFDYK